MSDVCAYSRCTDEYAHIISTVANTVTGLLQSTLKPGRSWSGVFATNPGVFRKIAITVKLAASGIYFGICTTFQDEKVFYVFI